MNCTRRLGTRPASRLYVIAIVCAVHLLIGWLGWGISSHHRRGSHLLRRVRISSNSNGRYSNSRYSNSENARATPFSSSEDGEGGRLRLRSSSDSQRITNVSAAAGGFAKTRPTSSVSATSTSDSSKKRTAAVVTSQDLDSPSAATRAHQGGSLTWKKQRQRAEVDDDASKKKEDEREKATMTVKAIQTTPWPAAKSSSSSSSGALSIDGNSSDIHSNRSVLGSDLEETGAMKGAVEDDGHGRVDGIVDAADLLLHRTAADQPAGRTTAAALAPSLSTTIPPPPAPAAVAKTASTGGGKSSEELQLRVRVATYNLLNPMLATESAMPECGKESLNPRRRLERILRKLSTETAKRSVICLQEISLRWAGPLHSFFQQRDYHLVLGQIVSFDGHSMDDYMGSGIAVPNDQFLVERAKIFRLSDLMASASATENINSYSNNNPSSANGDDRGRRGDGGERFDSYNRHTQQQEEQHRRLPAIFRPSSSTPRLGNKPSFFSSSPPSSSLRRNKHEMVRRPRRHPKLILEEQRRRRRGAIAGGGAWFGEGLVGKLKARLLGLIGYRPRSNKIVFVQLRNPALNTRVCVATYHLPCAFRTPGVLSLHSVYLSNFVHGLAKGEALVLAGDLNIKPSDLAYKLITVPRPNASKMNITPRATENYLRNLVMGESRKAAIESQKNNKKQFPDHQLQQRQQHSNTDMRGQSYSMVSPPPSSPPNTFLRLVRRKFWGAGGEPMPTHLLKSAYRCVYGHEPEFTTYSKIEDRDRFISTLDYILVSPTVQVKRVLRLPGVASQHGPLPSMAEPSDHLMLAATIGVPRSKRVQPSSPSSRNSSRASSTHDARRQSTWDSAAKVSHITETTSSTTSARHAPSTCDKVQEETGTTEPISVITPPVTRSVPPPL
eukprot:jgi/Bigna1/71570/fgenesh1_pg.16_\